VDNPLSLNRYTYVHNNPLRYWDPSGTKVAEMGSVGGGGAPAAAPIPRSLKEAVYIITAGVIGGSNAAIFTSSKDKTKTQAIPYINVNDERLKNKNIVYRALNDTDVQNIFTKKRYFRKKIYFQGIGRLFNIYCMALRKKLGIMILGYLPLKILK